MSYAVELQVTECVDTEDLWYCRRSGR